MKLLLINPDYMRYNSPPLGFISLAAYIRRECPFLEIKFFDQISEKEIFNKIRKDIPKIIAFTAVSENYYLVKRFAEKIKNNFPEIILVLGGVHISTSPESFKASPFDIAIRGEGEIPFSKLLKSINENQGIDETKLIKIRGIMFKKLNKIIDTGMSEIIKDLDNLPLPARDLINNKYYSLPTISGTEDFDPCGPIITSRGCPYNCRFCSSYTVWGQRVRFFSAERVAQEIEILYKKYKYKKVLIVDDVFTINKPRIKKIISLLKKKKLLGKIKFLILGRADCFDEEMARLLKELNVISVTFGIETGSQKVLTYLKRGRITIEDGINAIRLSRKYKIMGGGFFMIGSPYETLEDMQMTYEFIKTHCKDGFAIHQTVPLPGTEVWEYALRKGIIKKDFYDNPQKDFVDISLDLLLSDKVSYKEFETMFYKIKSLLVTKTQKNLIKKLKTLRIRHIKAMFNPLFLKKSFELRSRVLKKFLKPTKELKAK